jgi:hypothetical protein
MSMQTIYKYKSNEALTYYRPQERPQNDAILNWYSPKMHLNITCFQSLGFFARCHLACFSHPGSGPLSVAYVDFTSDAF